MHGMSIAGHFITSRIIVILFSSQTMHDVLPPVQEMFGLLVQTVLRLNIMKPLLTKNLTPSVSLKQAMARQRNHDSPSLLDNLWATNAPEVQGTTEHQEILTNPKAIQNTRS